MKRPGLNPKQWGASRSTPPPRLQDRAGVALGSAARRSSMRRRPAVAPAATAWSRSGLSDQPHGRRAHRPAGWRCGVTCGVGSRPGAHGGGGGHGCGTSTSGSGRCGRRRPGAGGPPPRRERGWSRSAGPVVRGGTGGPPPSAPQPNSPDTFVQTASHAQDCIVSEGNQSCLPGVGPLIG